MLPQHRSLSNVGFAAGIGDDMHACTLAAPYNQLSTSQHLRQKHLQYTTTYNNFRIKRYLSTDGNQSAQFIHPISQVVLDQLDRRQPSWFSQDTLRIHSDGTFEVGSEEIKVGTTFIQKENKHILYISSNSHAFGGEVVLMDGTGQAWAKPAFEFDTIIRNVDQLIEKIEDVQM